MLAFTIINGWQYFGICKYFGHGGRWWIWSIWFLSPRSPITLYELGQMIDVSDSASASAKWRLDHALLPGAHEATSSEGSLATRMGWTVLVVMECWVGEGRVSRKGSLLLPSPFDSRISAISGFYSHCYAFSLSFFLLCLSVNCSLEILLADSYEIVKQWMSWLNLPYWDIRKARWKPQSHAREWTPPFLYRWGDWQWVFESGFPTCEPEMMCMPITPASKLRAFLVDPPRARLWNFHFPYYNCFA